MIVNANQFEENLDALVCTNGFNLTMSGNNVDDHLRHGVVIENTYGSVLSGNMIEECNGTAIILDRDCYGITISANVIAHHLGGGVDLRDAWGCAVSANTFTLVHTNSIAVGPDSGRITITGNNFCNSYVGGKDRRLKDSPQPMSRDAGTGVFLKATTDVVVSGNTFSGLDGPAVWTEGECRRLLISNNIVTDVGRRQTEKKPAIDIGEAKESVVKDNIVSEPRTP
ncbi:MAG: right-handed parallel beta-helix repeat-containing protein [Verrucomicrobiae bacterium]|nr:right-handed parallel beta-helix repeat-containing protein [Verrucomicrobiae bacterium]